MDSFFFPGFSFHGRLYVFRWCIQQFAGDKIMVDSALFCPNSTWNHFLPRGPWKIFSEMSICCGKVVKMLVIPGTGLPRLRTQRGAEVHSRWSLTRTWTRMTRWPLRVSANDSFQKQTSAVGLQADDENILPGFCLSLAFFQPKIVVWRKIIGKESLNAPVLLFFPQCLACTPSRSSLVIDHPESSNPRIHNGCVLNRADLPLT